jgi:hypothetical protein
MEYFHIQKLKKITRTFIYEFNGNCILITNGDLRSMRGFRELILSKISDKCLGY